VKGFLALYLFNLLNIKGLNCKNLLHLKSVYGGYLTQNGARNSCIKIKIIINESQ